MDASTSSSKQGTTEIVFFDIETNVPNKAGQRFWVLEFGAIVVCPQNLVELETYSTLIRPGDLSAVALRSGRSDGITQETVAKSPLFEEVADKIFSILNGRVWAGHNIRRFDCVQIKEAFAEIGRPAPTPVGMMDSLGVLTGKFGRRAGNMKMATLASYFNLGHQKHRSLEDVRMNLEVLKNCATVLFLLMNKSYPFNLICNLVIDEANLPGMLNGNWPGLALQRSQRGVEVTGNCHSERKLAASLHQLLLLIVLLELFHMPQGELGKERVQNLLCRAQRNQPLNNILKHSHSLLR
ncbi:hypothetical protein DVH24_033968 [Malus domestica]|uniref:Exonuclease domain-containing protein n=1 Tax=Malus domestica TaxID=3750 RepID=A0A498KQG6_MALDO|nr:hypothetical protein DVH24_033968 [Malus domestica]